MTKEEIFENLILPLKNSLTADSWGFLLSRGKIFIKQTSIDPVLAEIRQAFADYVASEGCSCCQDTVSHDEAMQRLAKLLKIKKYSDGSGFNCAQYRSKK